MVMFRACLHVLLALSLATQLVGMGDDASKTGDGHKAFRVLNSSAQLHDALDESGNCANLLVNAFHTKINSAERDAEMYKVFSSSSCSRFSKSKLLRLAHKKAVERSRTDDSYEPTIFNLAVKSEYYENWWSNQFHSWGPVLLTGAALGGWTYRKHFPVVKYFFETQEVKPTAKGDDSGT